MTAQKGKDLLLKVDSNGAGSFVTVAGLRARTLAFNAATVDDLRGRWAQRLTMRASQRPKPPSPPRQNEHLRPIHARFMEAQLALSLQ